MYVYYFIIILLICAIYKKKKKCNFVFKRRIMHILQVEVDDDYYEVIYSLLLYNKHETLCA